MDDPQIHAALVNLAVIAITGVGIMITSGFLWAKSKIDRLTQQVEHNTPLLEDTEKRVSKLENGGTTARVDSRLAEHGLIERRIVTDGTADRGNNSTASSGGTPQ